jgi:hypothetical protein
MLEAKPCSSTTGGPSPTSTYRTRVPYSSSQVDFAGSPGNGTTLMLAVPLAHVTDGLPAAETPAAGSRAAVASANQTVLS